MQHCDEETLSLMALGQVVGDAASDHVSGCDRCRAELDSLRAVVTAVRVDASPAPAVAPPARVWDAIAASTGVTSAPRPEFVGAAAGPDVPTGDPTAAPTTPVTIPVAAGTRPASRRERRAARPPARRLRESLPILAVAAAALVVGILVGAGGTLSLRSDPSPTPSPQDVVSRTELDGLEAAPGASGSAEVVRTASGRVLQVDVAELGKPDGFYEVWLIDKAVRRMVPVGVLRGSTGTFVVPDGVDIGDYPVVDVSLEPLDGDPRHSGTSVLRGTIQA